MDPTPESPDALLTTRSAGGVVRAALVVLFFLTGACGLVYEVVWMRMLTLIFGATAFATSAILASFFTGLALGAWYFGPIADRSRRPLRIYALLEIGVAAFAFLMPVLLDIVTGVYVGIAREFDLGFYGISAVRFVLSFAVLVLPATLMGGTLPVVVRFFARSRRNLGKQVGGLYAANTLGAVVGTVSAGFFLILLLGVRETAFAAGVLNLLIAAVVLLLDRRWGSVESAPPPSEVAEPDAPTRPHPPGKIRWVLAAVAVAGFCALALEVFWTRALVFFLDNSTHAFTTILTAFLIGIGLGSLVVAAFIDERRRLLAWLGWIEILVGLSALLAIPAIDHLTPVFRRMADVSVDSQLAWRWTGMRFLTTLSVVLVPTLLMGMAFPVAAKICATRVTDVGRALGRVYALNTLGGVLGSVTAGFLLIPLIGLQAGIVLVAMLNVLVGLGLLLAEERVRLPGRVLGGTLAVGTMAGGVLLLGSGGLTLTSYYEAREIDEILAYEEGVGATVKVYRDTYGDRILSINGFPVAGEPPEYQDAQKGLAHFPLLLSGVDAPRVGIVGFGAGGTSWSVLRHPGAEVYTVELVPAVPRQAGFFPDVNHDVLDHPRFNLILDDGRNHLLVTDRVYDVLSVDATSPKMAGNGSLYTRDFYRLLRDRLSDEGVAVQWIPHHLLSSFEVRMTVRSFLEVFPHSSLWFSPLRQNMVLIGSVPELRIDVQALEEAFARQEVREDLATLNVAAPMDFLGGFVMGPEALAAFSEGVPVNTDNHPYLEFSPALAYFVGAAYRLRNLQNFRSAREPVLPWLVNLGDTEAEKEAVRRAVAVRFEAVGHSIAGDIHRLLGERREAMREYSRAIDVDPSEKNWLNTALDYQR